MKKSKQIINLAINQLNNKKTKSRHTNKQTYKHKRSCRLYKTLLISFLYRLLDYILGKLL